MSKYASVFKCFLAAGDPFEEAQEFLLPFVGFYVNEVGRWETVLGDENRRAVDLEGTQ